MSTTLVILAAGLSTRYGAPKQLDAVGPHGETLFDYAIHDAVAVGTDRVVVVTQDGMMQPVRDHVNDRFAGVVDLEVVPQRVDDVPDSAAPRRVKPWGTGHAILAARNTVRTPFAVCNADDFYGADAYRAIVEHLTTHRSDALVGYPLGQTLTPAGGVSRAVCRVDGGSVSGIVEVFDIRRNGGTVRGRDVDGRPREFTGHEPVSMNLWGFTPDVFPRLERQFHAFLARDGSDPEAEFRIGTAIDEQIGTGQTRVTLVSASTQWFGITYPADKEIARSRLASLVAEGAYPSHVRGG